jgi:hypothetical protein
MEQGIIARVGERLKQALDGLFAEPAPPTPQFPSNAPQPPSEPTITISKSRTDPNPETREPLGKITSYNWQGDPYTDTNSRNWIGSFGGWRIKDCSSEVCVTRKGTVKDFGHSI